MNERRPTPRYPVILPALCQASDGFEFHAVTVDISAAGIKLRSVILPHVDHKLTCSIRNVGQFQTMVIRASACDFAVRVTSQNPTPGSIARRLIELSQQQAQIPNTVRISRRIVPNRTTVEVSLGNGVSVVAQIINLSASGVALLIDTPLALGQPILVGRHKATVRRQIEGGVGVAFLTPLAQDAVDERTEL
ncbi:PilZ domain-containing protein [Methylobacterium sp. J-077]|uniref:PilZ domain-containing protein n=1 Tax=Methylobacterium sp. J-077 TaxID=2836656 RepID=UPI001FB8AD71|nr:PilZ domain-containing protein [Methylobacterium sp. J-077]MCJ2124770.1 PilZ domain-containing protein [Methylobacterium sp. J-077]